MEFREVLGQLRREQGMNQEQLAEQIGVSRQAVSKWETGEASPDLPNLLALADALDVSLDVLCARAERETTPPPPVAEAPAPKKRRWWIGVLITAVIIFFVLPTLAILAFNFLRPEMAASDTLSEKPYQRIAESISGLQFTLDSDRVLTCKFACPATNGGNYTYDITLSCDTGDTADIKMDTDYRYGVVTGRVQLSGELLRRQYTAALDITDSEGIFLTIPLAYNIGFSGVSSVTWQAITGRDS